MSPLTMLLNKTPARWFDAPLPEFAEYMETAQEETARVAEALPKKSVKRKR